MSLYIGYDVGSISVNRAVVDDKGKVISVLPYTRHLGDPVKLVTDDLKSLYDKYGKEISGICFTGSGAKDLAANLEIGFTNEIEAIITSVKQTNTGSRFHNRDRRTGFQIHRP